MGKQWELETCVENIWVDKPENLEAPYSPEPSMWAASFLLPERAEQLDSVETLRYFTCVSELQDDALLP